MAAGDEVEIHGRVQETGKVLELVEEANHLVQNLDVHWVPYILSSNSMQMLTAPSASFPLCSYDEMRSGQGFWICQPVTSSTKVYGAGDERLDPMDKLFG